MKKNPIIFIAMLIALAFTSCQMNTDDNGVNPVVPPAPTYKITVTATNGTVTLSKTEAKAGEKVFVESIEAANGYTAEGLEQTFQSKDGKTLTLDFGTEDGKRYFVMPECNVVITVTFKAATPTTDSTQWNLVASVIKHENGVGKNDGAFHGTITLNKAKANTGDTVTITVTPDSGYELGELFLGPISGEKQSIGKVNSFTMPNYAVGVTARFDPINGYCVNVEHESHSTFIKNTDKSSFAVGEEASFIVRKDYAHNTANYAIILNGEDISNNFTSIKADKKWTFSMPAHDVVVKVAKRNQ